MQKFLNNRQNNTCPAGGCNTNTNQYQQPHYSQQQPYYSQPQSQNYSYPSYSQPSPAILPPANSQQTAPSINGKSREQIQKDFVSYAFKGVSFDRKIEDIDRELGGVSNDRLKIKENNPSDLNTNKEFSFSVKKGEKAPSFNSIRFNQGLSSKMNLDISGSMDLGHYSVNAKIVGDQVVYTVKLRQEFVGALKITDAQGNSQTVYTHKNNNPQITTQVSPQGNTDNTAALQKALNDGKDYQSRIADMDIRLNGPANNKLELKENNPQKTANNRREFQLETKPGEVAPTFNAIYFDDKKVGKGGSSFSIQPSSSTLSGDYGQFTVDIKRTNEKTTYTIKLKEDFVGALKINDSKNNSKTIYTHLVEKPYVEAPMPEYNPPAPKTFEDPKTPTANPKSKQAVPPPPPEAEAVTPEKKPSTEKTTPPPTDVKSAAVSVRSSTKETLDSLFEGLKKITTSGEAISVLKTEKSIEKNGAKIDSSYYTINLGEGFGNLHLRFRPVVDASTNEVKASNLQWSTGVFEEGKYMQFPRTGMEVPKGGDFNAYFQAASKMAREEGKEPAFSLRETIGLKGFRETLETSLAIDESHGPKYSSGNNPQVEQIYKLLRHLNNSQMHPEIIVDAKR